MSAPAKASALHERLRKFATTRSLSDIARNTGTPFSTVHRFLNGGRVTADFCAALIREYGLNASWLMLGDGPMFPEVVPDERGENANAGNILELVSAMSAVSRVRLGALDGRNHAKTLKELNDALSRYESLRQDLNQRSAAVMSRLLDALENALNSFQRDRADDLAKTAEQVHRLCDDEALERRYLSLRSHAAFLERDVTQSLRFERKLVRNSLAEGRIANSEDYRHIARLAINLFWEYQGETAQRICDAALILAGEGDGSEHFAFLAFIASTIHVDCGDLNGGRKILPLWRDLCQGPSARGMRAYIGIMPLLAGEIDADKYIEIGGRTESTAINLLEYAFWTEDDEDLKKSIALMREVEMSYPDSHITLDLAVLFRKYLKRKSTDLVKGLKYIADTHARRGADPAKAQFFFAATMFAHAGLIPEAEKALVPNLPGMDQDGGRTHLYSALLARNILRVYGRTRKQRKKVGQAKAFFEASLKAGYNAYRPWFESWTAEKRRS